MLLGIVISTVSPSPTFGNGISSGAFSVFLDVLASYLSRGVEKIFIRASFCSLICSVSASIFAALTSGSASVLSFQYPNSFSRLLMFSVIGCHSRILGSTILTVLLILFVHTFFSLAESMGLSSMLLMNACGLRSI